LFKTKNPQIIKAMIGKNFNISKTVVNKDVALSLTALTQSLVTVTVEPEIVNKSRA
jgi:hypothetical protein